MYSKRILVTILVLASLSSSTFGARTTTARSTTPGKATKPSATSTSKDGIALRVGQNSSNATRKGANTGKIVTTRFGANGNPEERCQCTVFYLCDQGNVVEIQPGSGNECTENNQVCCRIPLDTLTTDEPVLPSIFNPEPAPVTPVFTESTSTSSYSQPPIDGSQPQGNCVCVPFYQCMNYDPLVQTSGAGIIDPRFPCTAPDVCCSSEVLPPGTSGGNPNPPQVPSIPDTPQQPPYVEPPQQPPYVEPPQTPSVPPYVPPVSTPNANECGIRRPSIDNRISAPEHLAETSFGEFPWMALILTTEIAPNGTRTENVFVCGASLLSPTVVLTAAHCVAQRDVNLLKVRVGEYNTHQGATEPAIHQDRAVSRFSLHSNYNNRVLFNDVALLIVESDFTFASHISPICTGFTNSLYADPSAYNPSQCLATGWGKNAFSQGSFQTTLKRVDLTIIPREECQNRLRQTRLGSYFILDPSFICAGGQPGFDTCQGDGGGPLVCVSRDNPNKYIQVGIVSWGIGCASNVPGVYASLEANREWLTTEFNTMSVFRRGSK